MQHQFCAHVIGANVHWIDLGKVCSVLEEAPDVVLVLNKVDRVEPKVSSSDHTFKHGAAPPPDHQTILLTGEPLGNFTNFT